MILIQCFCKNCCNDRAVSPLPKGKLVELVALEGVGKKERTKSRSEQ